MVLTVLAMLSMLHSEWLRKYPVAIVMSSFKSMQPS